VAPSAGESGVATASPGTARAGVTSSSTSAAHERATRRIEARDTRRRQPPIRGLTRGARCIGGARYKSAMAGHRVFKISVASVYPHYVTKAEKKGRTKEEVDEIMCWLTGYEPRELHAQLDQGTDFETFFAQAPALNPSRKLITGVICGIRVEDIEDPLMQELRYLDKLVDELARGKAMEKILRTP
jgi:hypothetical protein